MLARDVPLAAAARSRGLGNTPTGARVYLAGRGWRLLAAPPAHPRGAAALATNSGGAASFLPDVSGDWTLADGDGRELRLRTAHYDETPLDCGRAGCHADIAPPPKPTVAGPPPDDPHPAQPTTAPMLAAVGPGGQQPPLAAVRAAAAAHRPARHRAGRSCWRSWRC